MSSTPANVETQSPADRGCAECAPIDGADAERIAKVFKALGDPTRLKLLSMITASPAGEMCACDLTEPVGLSQPTVSHHMKLLVDAGLATREQRGRWAYYRPVPDILDEAAKALFRREPDHER
ncbi:ArsR/SmtB family transcription factor [Brevibacterium casei]|uniref:ArsR family transcriptional regulator n=1 Tax=Brevibacterium casei CIP 102111 TaxID=1255625 RepID=A0A2H1JDC1_9MICO|nr:metalloregulator ArsR/SmtB family transcription factor [Brevibacterium casei]MCT1549803.1 metalloregulator ArsR/SmtB family transcription factor [Brevibacterium casei]MCT1560828.1 metalloregulator ArsR/SmtB family transcription factor [Brevibacterium casei]MCT2207363.1 metalloregulator ArsR/SmtB family transcription factor [Brevibacterium casei]QPR39002.1 helix-turn-helix transcriptional regulator [Brevibacterium casei]QPR43168.1 helix-turn-helix transcriptional regulator [Brevibacterium ca